MKAKRLLSLLLTLVMMLSIVAMSAGTAFAAGDDKAIAGVEVLGDKMNNTKAAQVHFGDMSWRIIGYNGVEKSVAAPEGMLTFFSDEFLSVNYFNPPGNKTNVYAGSNVQKAMDNAAAGLFNDLELAAIVERDLKVGEETGKESDPNQNKQNTLMCDGVAQTPVEDAILWPLSTAEARATNTQIRSIPTGKFIKENGEEASIKRFWLRSPGYLGPTTAAMVYNDGITVTAQGVASAQAGIRPAFNMKMDSVLLVSAKGAKAVTGVAEVATYKKTEWKLTVLDESRNFTATVGSENGNVITVNYSGAKTGSSEFLTVVIKNAVTGGVTEYGRVKNLTAASGSVDIDLTGINMKGKELYVFNEQYNGGAKDDGWKTDFGSKLVKLEVSIAPAVSQTVKDLHVAIDALPEAEDFTLEDKEAVDAINAAKAAYEALSADEKALITTDKLDAAYAYLKELQGEPVGGGNNDAGNNAGNNDANNNAGNNDANNGEDNTTEGSVPDEGKDDEKKPNDGKTVSNGVVIGLWIALVVVLCGSIAAAVVFILKMKKMMAPAAEVTEETVEETEEAEAAEEAEEATEEETEE